VFDQAATVSLLFSKMYINFTMYQTDHISLIIQVESISNLSTCFIFSCIYYCRL